VDKINHKSPRSRFSFASMKILSSCKRILKESAFLCAEQIKLAGEFPKENNHIHEADERIKETSFIKMYEIYKKALFDLAALKEEI